MFGLKKLENVIAGIDSIVSELDEVAAQQRALAEKADYIIAEQTVIRAEADATEGRAERIAENLKDLLA